MTSVRFDDFMQKALYGDGGFYTSGSVTTGSRGDFITSPNVGPLFAEVVGRYFETVWQQSGQGEITIYDVGCNKGDFLNALSKSDVARDKPWRLVGVDYLHGDLTPEEFNEVNLANSIVFANELLDNMPFRVLRKVGKEPSGTGPNGAFQELFVVSGQRTWQSTNDFPAWVSSLVQELEIGIEFPVHQQARAWVEQVLERKPLSLLCIDYGMASSAELADRGDWLRLYQDHQVSTDSTNLNSSADITTDVSFDQLPKAVNLQTQAQFLKEHGIDELVAEAEKLNPADALANLAAMKIKSRISESATLLDQASFGSFLVAGW